MNALPFPFLRVWGSVMHDGQPRAEVRDMALGVSCGDTETADFRPWRWAVIDANDRAPLDEDSGCAGPLGCYPGHPCPACQQTAVRWWYEWDRRNDERKWRATHDKGHPTEDAARKCGKKHGFPRLVEMNGHGARLRWADTQAVGGLSADATNQQKATP